MAKFVSIPTQVVGQPSILFNTDNIVAVIPPTSGDVTATGLYVKLLSQGKEYRLTLGGSTTTIQNTNAIAASNIINNAVTSANAAPINSPVNFPTVLLTAGAGATGQTNITVANTAGLSVGQVVTVVGGQGVFALNTTIASITNATTFVVSAAPTTTLAGATIAAATLTVTTIAVV
jgi:hypothetical protein